MHYYDDQADLRTLYQAYSSQIEFSKTQLWRVVNYGIWAIAGTMGLFKAFLHHQTWWANLCPIAISIIFCMCLYNILKCWRSMRVGREKFIEIRPQLSYSFIRTYTMHKAATIYTSWKYDFWIVAPLMFVVVAGCVLAYVVQLLDVDICSAGQFFHVWGFPVALVISFGFVLIILLHRFKKIEEI